MSKRFQVCVVGGGDIGHSHLRGWARVPDAEVVALVEPVPERRGDAGQSFGISHLYESFADALAWGDFNAVSVCTPACFHAEVACAALAAGKNVLCVKPMAIRIEEADAMVDAARASAGVLAIGFNTRLRWSQLGLLGRFQEGVIGRPAVFTHSIYQQVRFKLMMQERYGNGGPFVDIGVHHFDLWRGLFGSEATRVTARAQTFAQYQPEASTVREFAPDTGTAIVEFGSGDLGVFNVSWGMPRGVDLLSESSDVVIGPDGYIGLDRVHGIRIHRRGSEIELPGAPTGHAIEEDVVEFAARLRDGRSPFATGEDGRTALRIALAALESIQTGRTVELG